MFDTCINLHYQNYSQRGFSIIPYINRATNLSNNHRIIEVAVLELKELNFDFYNFNRLNLLKIWNDKSISFSTKILVTFWWGGLSHQFQAPKFYTVNNLMQLDKISKSLQQSLTKLMNFNDGENFKNIYVNLKDGEFKLSGIGSPFFTKIFQFYFECNPIPIHPIIADQWSMKSVLAEMITQENNEWKNIFKVSSNKNKLYVNFNQNGNEFEKYKIFNVFFNARLSELKNTYPELTAIRLEEILFGWARDINNPNNPRYIAENIIKTNLKDKLQN